MNNCFEEYESDLSLRPPPGLLVRKYGGSSLATPELVGGVAAELAALTGDGSRVVAVVSALGDTTDRLIALARQFTDRPDPRELDQLMATGEQTAAAVLSLALARRDVKAVSLSGDQAGIEVTGEPGAGVIAAIDPSRIAERMREHQVVVVAGFQGRDVHGELLTLGRGGSDTTAVALAAALGSPECEICTDVHGVRTADPRIVPDTRPVPELSYEAMIELARHGARVLHPRSVELAGQRGVTVRVRHSAHGGPVTEVGTVAPLERGYEVIGIAHDRDVRLVRVETAGRPPEVTAGVLARLTGSGLKPDVLSWPDRGELRFTVRSTAPLAGRIRELLGDVGWSVDDDLGSVSVIGTGLLDQPGCLAEVVRTIGELGVAVPAMVTSPSRLTVVLPAGLLDSAVRALHGSFGLNLPAEARS